jgi:hypothetical protein
MFGSSIAACGDINGDGFAEVAIGAPGSASCYVRVLEGSLMWASGSSLAGQYVTFSGNGGGSNSGMGTAIVSGFDLDGNGIQELAFSTPGFDGAFGADSGLFEIHEVSAPGFPFVAVYASTIASERLGQALDAKHDYDGDGVVDIVAGAPNSPDWSGHQGGRVVVLSGARLAAATPPYEVYTLMPGVLSHVAQLTFDTHFGAAVCASRDLNNDGVGEILVGSPDYFTGFGAAKGVMTIFSGASGALGRTSSEAATITSVARSPARSRTSTATGSGNSSSRARSPTQAAPTAAWSSATGCSRSRRRRTAPARSTASAARRALLPPERRACSRAQRSRSPRAT